MQVHFSVRSVKYKYSPISYMVTIFNPQCKDRLGWEINLDQGDEWQAEWK